MGAIWNAAATAPTTLPGAEMVLVYEWCQNVALASAAMTQSPSARDFGAAVMSASLLRATPADLLGSVRQARQAGDENEVVRRFRAWVRGRITTAGPPPAAP